jgi:DNA-binding SARP family transcriptional activator
MVEAELKFRILGPVEVVRNDTLIRLGGARQRALLAHLLLEGGRAVAADWLIDELWQGDPPSGASTLPSYVSRLRTAPEPPTSGQMRGLSTGQPARRLVWRARILLGALALTPFAPQEPCGRLDRLRNPLRLPPKPSA